MLNRWIMFERDKCEGCNHPKLMRMIIDLEKIPLDPLRVVVTCNCPDAIFQDWKQAHDLIVMAGKTTVLETVAMIADSMGGE